MKVTSIIAAVAGAIFRVVAAVAVVYAIYRGAGMCYDYGYRIFTEPAMTSGEGRTVTVTITPDMSAMDIGKLFEGRGLVRDARLFMMQYYLSEYREDVGPGTFDLSTAMTAEEMMQAMVVEKEEEEGEGDSSGRGSESGEGSSSSENGPPAGEAPRAGTLPEGIRPGTGCLRAARLARTARGQPENRMHSDGFSDTEIRI